MSRLDRPFLTFLPDDTIIPISPGASTPLGGRTWYPRALLKGCCIPIGVVQTGLIQPEEAGVPRGTPGIGKGIRTLMSTTAKLCGATNMDMTNTPHRSLEMKRVA